MSIAELKAAYDFVRQNVSELKQKASGEDFPLNKIPVYDQVTQNV